MKGPFSLQFSLRHLFEVLTWAAVAVYLFSLSDRIIAPVRLFLFTYFYLAFRAALLSRARMSEDTPKDQTARPEKRINETRWGARLLVGIAAVLGGTLIGMFGLVALISGGVNLVGDLEWMAPVAGFAAGAVAGAATGALVALFLRLQLSPHYATTFTLAVSLILGVVMMITQFGLLPGLPFLHFLPLLCAGGLAGVLINNGSLSFDIRATRWAGRSACAGVVIAAVTTHVGRFTDQRDAFYSILWLGATFGGIVGAIAGVTWIEEVARANRRKLIILAAAVVIGMIASDVGRRVWPSNDLKEIARFKAPGAVSCIAASPDGKKLIVGTRMDSSARRSDNQWRGHLSVWDTSTWTPIVELPQPRWVNSVAVSPDGETFAVAVGAHFDETYRSPGPDIFGYEPHPGQVKLYNLATMEEKADTPFDGRVHAVEFSQDGAFLAALIESAGGARGKVTVWDTATLTIQGELEGLREIDGDYWLFDNTELHFSPDGTQLAVADVSDESKEWNVTLWNLITKETNVVELPKGPITSLAYFPKGSALAVAAIDDLFVIDVTSPHPTAQSLFQPDINPLTLAFSPAGEALAVGGWHLGGSHPSGYGGVEIRDIASGGERARLRLTDRGTPVQALAFAPDGKTLYTGLENGEIIAWEITYPTAKD